METAHPCKFAEIVEKTINKKVDIPRKLNKTLKGEKKSIQISDYTQFKEYLLKS